MDAEGVDEFPSTPYLLDNFLPTVLLLLDHSALGTRTFQKERGVTFTNPLRKFWSTDHTPLTKALPAWDLTPLQDPLKVPPPPRLGPDTELAATQSWIVPDQDFSRKRCLPTMTWAQHARPRWRANSLAEALVASSPHPSPPPRPRPRVRHMPTRPVLNPPSRPPDSPEAMSTGRLSSPDILTYSDG